MGAKRLKYDDDMLLQINQNVDLLEYVSQQIAMERKGNDYWAHCPLHTDITPSFSITPEKNSYYCFSCGRSGGIIGYLMDFEGLKFDDAVAKAAGLAKVDLGKMCKSETIIFLRKLKLMQQNKREPYEHTVFHESELRQYEKAPVQEWLDEGIDQNVMDIFDIRIDSWNNRIIYPVRDIDGRLLNIKGRTRYPNYKEMRIPKYINYHTVGVLDYFQGLDITLPFVKEKKELIVFESIKSVMKAYGWGYKHAASAEKHTLTPEQISLLARLRADVVFAYDSDVSYRQRDVKENIDKLKRVTNVFIIEDKKGLLGGVEAKNAPVDLGRDIWETLYAEKRKVV